MKNIQKNKVKPFDNLSMECNETNFEERSWSNMMRKKMEALTLDNITVQNPTRYIDALGDHLMIMCSEVADIAEDFLNSVAEDLTFYVTGEGQEESKVASADLSIEKKRTSIVIDDSVSFVSQEQFIRDMIEKSKLVFGNENEEVVEKPMVVLAEHAVESKVTNSEGPCDSISSEVGTSLPSSPCLAQDDFSDTSCKRCSPIEYLQVTNEPCQCDSDEVAAVGNTMRTAETSEILSKNDAVVSNLAIEEFEDVQLEDCMEDSVHGELFMQNANNSFSYKQKLKRAFVSRLQWSNKKKSDVTTAQIGNCKKLDETNSMEQRQSKQLPQIKDSADDSDWEVL